MSGNAALLQIWVVGAMLCASLACLVMHFSSRLRARVLAGMRRLLQCVGLRVSARADQGSHPKGSRMSACGNCSGCAVPTQQEAAIRLHRGPSVIES
jgi:hypothetical protein